MDCLNANSISTFGGNPVAAAAANATLDYVLEHDLQKQAAVVGRLLLDGLRDAVGDLPGVADVRGKGLMIGVELAGRAPASPTRPRRRPCWRRPASGAADRQGRPATATACGWRRRSR